jgi:hypothetical protein
MGDRCWGMFLRRRFRIVLCMWWSDMYWVGLRYGLRGYGVRECCILLLGIARQSKVDT